MDTNKVWEITNGPSKDMLCDAFKYAYDREYPIKVVFYYVFGLTAPEDHPGAAQIRKSVLVRVTSLEHENGSGTSLNISGYVEEDESKWAAKDCTRFKAYFDTVRRRGTIQFF